MKVFRRHHGFTLVEIIIVIVIMGVMAVMAVPRLTVMMTRARIRNAMNNVVAIHAAEQVYQARNGVYVATANCTSADCSDLNSTAKLGLNIVPDSSTTYACTTTACTATCGTTFLITATLANPLNMTKGVAGYNPVCEAPTGTTPSADCP